MREKWIDLLKGIGMILVCIGHIKPDIFLETHIYSFHMPLFFFISGYLFIKSKYSFSDFLKRRFNGLIKPYLGFAIVSLIVGFIMGTNNIKDIICNFLFLKGTVGWNSPIWFLVVLFITEMCYYFISKVKFKLKINIIVLISGIVGYVIQNNNIILPFGIHIMPIAITFYHFGVIFKEYNIKKYIETNKVIFIFSSMFINIIFSNILNIRISVYHYNYGNFIYFYIGAIAGIILYSSIAIIIKENKLLDFIGKNTLFILGTQYFIFKAYLVIEKITNLKLVYSGNTIICLFTTIITLAIYYIIINIYNYLKLGNKTINKASIN